ncbi:Proto-oncogene tyrosine- kinase receptor Ret, partial [Paramuricea clavata]
MDGKELENLETKLTQLEIATEKSKTLLSSGKRVAIKRHLDALQTTANEANECRRTVEAFKITNKEELSEIKKWNDDLDLKFEPADAAIQNLEHFLAEAKKAEKFVTHEEELKHEMILHEKRMEMQAELSSASSSAPKHQKECKESERFVPRGCVYCGDLGHKAVQCENVSDVGERKKILARKGHCFNCATKPHRAADCTSKSACSQCGKRHHSSICDQAKIGNETDKHASGDKQLMTDGGSGEGIFPVVVIK